MIRVMEESRLLNCRETADRLMEMDKILILTHKNPDGDTLGSAAALCSALERAGKTARLYPNPQITDRLVPFVNRFLADEGYSWEKVVSVDSGSRDILAEGFEGDVDLLVDHHPTNTLFAPYCCVMPQKAACAEIVLEIIENIGIGGTEEEADLMYIGLSTDTGCFQYSNTTSETHYAAAALIEYGADSTELNRLFFNSDKRSRVALEAVLLNSFEFYHDDKVVVQTVTVEDVKKTGARGDDFDSIASIPTRISGTVLGVTVREREDGNCKVSLRSVPGFSCMGICTHFGGGGHATAAGYTAPGKAAEVKRELLEFIDSVWDENSEAAGK